MAEKEAILMKGNEAIAHAAIRCGADGYFGYPITPQSEVLETLAAEKPWETTGMVGSLLTQPVHRDEDSPSPGTVGMGVSCERLQVTHCHWPVF